MEVIHNFITEEEQQVLLEWIRRSDVPVLEADNFTPSNLTPRRLKIFAEDSEEFASVQNKIQQQLGCAPPSDWQGQIFIHEAGKFTRQHTDRDSLRTSLVVQEAIEGGNIVHGGRSHNVPERALAIFDPRVPHAVGQVKKGTRIGVTFFWKDN